MSGESILIDTNIALYLLSGDEVIAKILDGYHIYVSFVTELELLGFPSISSEELKKIVNF